MKKFKAEIDVMLHPDILDPQGKAVTGSMKNLNLSEIENVRIGKHITLDIIAVNKDDASQKVEIACNRLLANLVMEKYTYSLTEK